MLQARIGQSLFKYLIVILTLGSVTISLLLPSGSPARISFKLFMIEFFHKPFQRVLYNYSGQPCFLSVHQASSSKLIHQLYLLVVEFSFRALKKDGISLSYRQSVRTVELIVGQWKINFPENSCILPIIDNRILS